MCERTVLVSDLPKDVKEDDLHIYFQSRRKSDGGDIESIVYYPVTRSAKITFTDEQGKLVYGEFKLTCRMFECYFTIKRILRPSFLLLFLRLESTSIIVSGLSSRTTKDALQNYFENSRRSSGGDVKEVKVDGDKAIVTFELPEIAKRVLEWGKHTLDDHPLTVSRMQQDQPKKPTPTSEHDTATNEERSRVVRITGISHNTTKDALLNFFENKRRSGGGEIEDIQYIQDESLADITFCSAEDAERVSQKESLLLDDAKIGLTLKEIPKVLPKDPYKLHVMDISDTTTKDGLTSFMEVASGEEILNMIFGSNSNVMVMFKEPPDIEKVKRKCSTRALDGSHVKIETVSICDCVEVCGLGPSTTRDTIFYYFENARKSGGGDVKKVEYVDEETKALVFFEDFSVVDSVVARKHVINDATLKVVPHYSFLGETLANPRGRKKEKQLKVDPQTMVFIDKFFHQEFQVLLQEYQMKCTCQQGSGDVELCSIDIKIEKTKWKDHCTAIETYINQIVTRTVVVSQAAWNAMIEQTKQQFLSVKDRLDVVCKEKERLINVRGKKQDVDLLAEQLDDLSKEIDKKIEYDKAKITKVIDLTKPQLDLLSFTGFVKNLQAQFKDLEATMLKKELSIHFRGPDQVVREGNIAVWQALSTMKDHEMELPKSIVSIFASIAGNVFLSKELKNNQIDAVVSSDANDETKLIVTAVDRRDVNKAIDLIKKVTAEDSVSLDPDQKRLIMSERWMQLIDNFKKSMLLKVTTELASSTVCIAGAKEEVVKAKSQIDAFFEENTIISKMVEADTGRTKFLFRFEKDEIKRVEETLKHHSVKICCDENDEDISIRGTKEGTEQACKNVQKLIDQIKHRSIDLDKPGIKRLFNESQGKKLLSNVENDHTCIIERCTLTDDNKRRSAVGLKLNESLSKRICSCVTPEGKNIILFKGDLTEHKVDVMVFYIEYLSIVAKHFCHLYNHMQFRTKSYGGNIESIVYYPDTRSAKITFTDEQVVKRVVCKHHHIKDSWFAVQMASDLSGDTGSTSILVSGLSSRTTKDALQNYFENSRRSSGGDVKDIIVNGDKAIVTFELPETIFEILNEKAEEEHKRKYAVLVSKNVHWLYIDGDEEVQYDNETNAKIEQAFMNKQTSINFTLLDEFKKEQRYKIDFASMTETNVHARETTRVVRKEHGKENTIISKMVEADAGRTKFLFRFEKDEMKRVEETLKHHSVKICCDENDEDMSIRGTKEGTEQACKKVQKLIDQIKHRTIDLDKPGIKRLFNERQGKKLLSNVENNHTCIIERCGPSTTDRGYIEMAGNSGTAFKPDTRMWLKVSTFIVFNKHPTKNIKGTACFLSLLMQFPVFDRLFCLKVFASSDKQLSKADTAIKELIREQSKKKTIDNPDIEGLSHTQEKRILRLQERYFTEIEVQKRLTRIIISGVTNDVSETAFAIFEILNEKAEEEHKRKYAELLSKNVHWFYIDGDEEVQYDDATNAKIEQAYMDKQTSINITLIEDHKEQRYKIDFASMTETNLHAHETTRVVRKEHGKGIPLPSHWEPQPRNADGKEKVLHLVPLDPVKHQQEYDSVKNAITKTSPINIVNIERIQNPEVHQAYMVKKQKMDEKNGSNEKKLFHGTPVDICNQINHHGFNRSYCGKNAVVFGKGVYFARDASYSMRPTYSPPDLTGNRCMYLASVLVGECALGNSNMITPPPKDPNNPILTYDTTVDNVNNPSVFVAFHDNQNYPEYLITFK
ncbi:hypothetical protein QZH41_016615 [Actinostola sp. cb2023]|nr:hypothetical protein QZH41_016615 [Actinostola sp. cb2023]